MRFGLSRRRVAVIATAAVVVLAGVAAAVWSLSGNGSGGRPTQTTFTVRDGTVTVTTSASGTVAPIDSRALTFGATGTVSTLNVKAGDHVTTGETLATIDPTDAEAAVSSAQSALDAANTNLALAEQQATANATPTSAPCVAAAAFALAPAPSPSPSASPSPHPSASPTPSPSPSRHPTGAPAPTGTQTCGGGSGAGRGSSNQSTGTDPLMRAQQAVNNAELSLEQAETALTGTKIVAPSDGRVLSVSGSVGQTATSGGSGFIVMGGLNSLAVEAQFSEADVAAVAIGQKATVTLADHAGTSYPATVTEIDPAGTTSGQLVRYGVQLEFVNPPSDLLIGQSAVAAVVTASASNVLYVPSAALSNLTGNSATVRVRTPTGDATRTVTVGLAGDQGTEITSGLSAGDVVVIAAA